MEIKTDCRFFRGDIPCAPHKEYGVHCANCSYYEPIEHRILMIKLGAIGDVIRTTALLRRIRAEMPGAKIYWLTYYPDAVPRQWVDEVLPFSLESVLSLETIPFDWVINLDKDHYACALTRRLQYQRLSGFTVRDGVIVPADHRAEPKYLTGLFDDISQQNPHSYLEEIFYICGWEFRGEEYVIEPEPAPVVIPNEGKPIIAMNPGCGKRWISRQWSPDRWKTLIRLCQKEQLFPMVVGGKEDEELNRHIADETGAFYPGTFPLRQFFDLIARADVLVTPVTMALHVALGVKTPVVVFVNIFNPAEFELYNRGILLLPEKPCRCYFRQRCVNPEYFCLDYLSPDTVLEAVMQLVKKSTGSQLEVSSPAR